MSAVGLIINERSNRVQSILDDLLHVAGQFPSLRTAVLNGIEGLDKALGDFSRAKTDTVIVAGGDGTIQAALTDSINMRRFEQAPNFVALPCGMTNVIAADCGLQGQPVDSFDKFMWRRGRGAVKSVRRSLMGVTIGDRAPIYGFFLGAGAFHDAVKFSRTEIQSKGARRSLALGLSIGGAVINAVFGERPTTAPLVADIASEGAPDGLDPQMTLALASTLQKLMLGVYPFWGKGEGALSVMTVGFPARRLALAAPTILRGRSAPWFAAAGYHSWRSKGLSADFEGSFVFDGEIFDVKKGERVVIDTAHDTDFLV